MRYGGKGFLGTLARLLVVTPLLLAARSPAVPAADPKTEAKGKAPNVAQITETVEAVAEAQRSLAASLAQLQAQVRELQSALGELRAAAQERHDALQTAVDQLLDQLKETREEVRGLYVESSGVKSDVAQVGKQVETLDQSLGGFRLSSGIVVAVLIVLQVVLVGLMFRGRG